MSCDVSQANSFSSSNKSPENRSILEFIIQIYHVLSSLGCKKLNYSVFILLLLLIYSLYGHYHNVKHLSLQLINH